MQQCLQTMPPRTFKLQVELAAAIIIHSVICGGTPMGGL